MKRLTIQSSIGNSEILAGETLANVSKYLPENKKVAVITDDKVYELYGPQFPESDLLIKIPQGEKNKTLHTLDIIFEKLIEAEFDRTSFILGIGGGIVCDVAGFAASVFMRGLNFGFVSTTLLSQVDASVGGKNGVNFRGYKNMIGTFCLPDFVICDPEMLKTLSEEELLSGLAETVKHGAIADASLFEFIEKNSGKIKSYDHETLERIVYDSVVIKSNIVNQDAREKGIRRLLNFGHTIGHAIEKKSGVKHGMAISMGMTAAVKISMARNLISKSEADRLISLFNILGLPTEIPIKPQELIDALKRDKKREGNGINFILLKSIGTAIVEKLTLQELESYINDLH